MFRRMTDAEVLLKLQESAAQHNRKLTITEVDFENPTENSHKMGDGLTLDECRLAWYFLERTEPLLGKPDFGNTKEYITRYTLAALGACWDARGWFHQTFPDRFAVPVGEVFRALLKHSPEDKDYLDWFYWYTYEVGLVEAAEAFEVTNSLEDNQNIVEKYFPVKEAVVEQSTT